MQTKTAVKVISLYDLIATNQFMIYETLHHIIILLFNHSSIKTLKDLIVKFPEYDNQFKAIIDNLYICNQITFVVICGIYFVREIYIKKNNTDITVDDLRVYIMLISFVIKYIYTFIQIYNFEDNWTYDNKEIDFGEHYLIIVISYKIRLLILYSIIISILLLFIVLVLSLTF